MGRSLQFDAGAAVEALAVTAKPSSLSTKETFVRYYLADRLIRCMNYALNLSFLDTAPMPQIKLDDLEKLYQLPQSEQRDFITPQSAFTQALKFAKRLGFSRREFEPMLREYLTALTPRARESSQAHRLVIAELERWKKAVTGIQNTPDKARDSLRALIDIGVLEGVTDQVLDAMIYLWHEVPEVRKQEVLEFWEMESVYFEEAMKREYPEAYDIEEPFWEEEVKNLGVINSVSRYRFRDRLKIPKFSSVFELVEADFQARLMGCRTKIDALPIALDLWYVSRSKALRTKCEAAVEVALKRICTLQREEKWWFSGWIVDAGPGGGTAAIPSPFATALSALALFTLSASSEHRRRGVSAAGWLCDHQDRSGSWPKKSALPMQDPESGDIVTTVLCLEVLLGCRDEIENVRTSVELGKGWLLGQQDELGSWDDGSYPFPFATVLVLELLGRMEKGVFEVEEVEMPREATETHPTTKLSATAKFPTPSGTEWKDIRIRVVSEDEIYISVKGCEERRYDFGDIGFKNRRTGEKRKPWGFFLALAKFHGEIGSFMNESDYPSDLPVAEHEGDDEGLMNEGDQLPEGFGIVHLKAIPNFMSEDPTVWKEIKQKVFEVNRILRTSFELPGQAFEHHEELHGDEWRRGWRTNLGSLTWEGGN